MALLYEELQRKRINRSALLKRALKLALMKRPTTIL